MKHDVPLLFDVLHINLNMNDSSPQNLFATVLH